MFAKYTALRREIDMSKLGFAAFGVAVLALGAWSQRVLADTAEAMCEVHKHGEVRKNASGPCDFSQRQGYVSISLRNGDRWELAPGERPDHFKDQNGNGVKRTAKGNSHEYKWEHQAIFVTFESSGSAHGGESKHARQGVGAAETACTVAVDRQLGGRAKSLRVLSSESSRGGSTVIVAADGEHWRCLASDDGEVTELSKHR
jgi:hypothetical protein